MRRRSLGLIFVFSLILSVNIGSVSASPDEITVCYGWCDYFMIQDAINSADPGDTILVKDGTYVENVFVNKPNLTIKSENGPEKTIVEAAISYHEVFDIRENYVNIVGFTMASASSSYGIYLYYVQHCLVLNNTFYGNYYGVGLKHSDNNIISNSNAYNNKYYGIYLESSDNNEFVSVNASFNDKHGFYLWYSHNNNISNFFVSNNDAYGIYLYRCKSNNIYNNHFNNTNNFYIDGDARNYWTKPISHGTNIVGGPYLGGNFWSKPDGTGFSEVCNDTNYDGICDTSYGLTLNNRDFLPLTVYFHTLQYNLYKVLNNTGLNLITLPLNNSFATAEDLCQNISYADTITKWDASRQKFKGHPCGTPFGNFDLVEGQGYFVSVTQSMNWTLTGPGIELPDIKLLEVPDDTGLNLIGLPYNSIISPFTAEGLCQDITHSDTITKWNPMTQQYIGHPCNTPFTNFNLNNGEGYFISVTQNTTWVPQ